MHKLIISDQVQKELIRISDYLSDNWGISSAVKFEKRTEQVFEKISKMPTIGAKVWVQMSIYRETPITKQNTLIYKIENDSVVYLVKIFDNRQHPDKKYIF